MSSAPWAAKRCCTCKQEKPASEFYADKRARSGLRAQCKRCHCDTSMRTRDPEKKRAANRRWMRDYSRRPDVMARERVRSRRRNKTPEAKARLALNAAVQAGRVQRPGACARCGMACRPNGHHHDYSKPLAVEWLCTGCHGKEHRHGRR